MARGSRGAEARSLLNAEDNRLGDQQDAAMLVESAVEEDEAAPAPPLPPDVLMMILPRVKTAPGSGPQMVCKDWRDVLAPYEATLQWLAQGASEQGLTMAVSKAAACPQADKSSGMVSDLLDDGLAEDVSTAEYLDTVRAAMRNAARTGHSELCQQLVQRYDTVDAAEKAAAAAAQAAAKAAADAAAAANPAPVHPMGLGMFGPAGHAGFWNLAPAGWGGPFHPPQAAAGAGAGMNEDEDEDAPFLGYFGQPHHRPRQPCSRRFQLLSAGIEGAAEGKCDASHAVLPALLAAVPQQDTSIKVCVQLVGEGLQVAAKHISGWFCEQLWKWLRTRFPLTEKQEFQHRLVDGPAVGSLFHAVLKHQESQKVFAWLDHEIFCHRYTAGHLDAAVKADRLDILQTMAQWCEVHICGPVVVIAAKKGELGPLAAMLGDTRWRGSKYGYLAGKPFDDAQRLSWLHKAVKAAVSCGQYSALRLLLGYPAPSHIQAAIRGSKAIAQPRNGPVYLGFGYHMPHREPAGPGRHVPLFSTQALLLTCIKDKDQATALQLVPHLVSPPARARDHEMSLLLEPHRSGASEPAVDMAAVLTQAVQQNMPVLGSALLQRCPSLLTYEALTAADQLPRTEKLQMLGHLVDSASHAKQDILTAAAAAGSVGHVHMLLLNGVPATAAALERGASADGGSDAERAELCHLLYEAGARLAGPQGTAALLAAAQLERLETCRVLVNAGADASVAKALRWEAQQVLQRDLQRVRTLEAIEALRRVDAGVPEAGPGTTTAAHGLNVGGAADGVQRTRPEHAPPAAGQDAAASTGAAAADVAGASAAPLGAPSDIQHSQQQAAAPAARVQGAAAGTKGQGVRDARTQRKRQSAAGRQSAAAKAVSGKKRGREGDDGDSSVPACPAPTASAAEKAADWGGWAAGVMRFFFCGPGSGRRESKRAKL